MAPGPRFKSYLLGPLGDAGRRGEILLCVAAVTLDEIGEVRARHTREFVEKAAKLMKDLTRNGFPAPLALDLDPAESARRAGSHQVQRGGRETAST